MEEITKGLQGGGVSCSEVLDDPINLFLEFPSDEISILLGISYSSTTRSQGETYD
jgi:hypothetical protein